MTDLERLSARLDALERQNRRLYRLVFASLGLAVFAFVVASGPPVSAQANKMKSLEVGELTVQTISFVDDKGKSRGGLYYTKKKRLELEIFDPESGANATVAADGFDLSGGDGKASGGLYYLNEAVSLIIDNPKTEWHTIVSADGLDASGGKAKNAPRLAIYYDAARKTSVLSLRDAAGKSKQITP